MTSRLISSTQSSPRRMVQPALPLCFSRSATTTPRLPSPTTEMDTVTQGLAEVKVSVDDEIEATTRLAQGPPTTPTPNNAQIAIVVDEAGSPTRQEVLPTSANVILPTKGSATEINTTGDSEAQRIMNNLRGPFGNPSGFAPRPDRVGNVVTAENAQGIFPPDALIFVANLSTQKSEQELEVTCHEAFDQYGQNHVKIRRDKHKHPFAFVQYEQVEDATAAIIGAYGLILDGRKIRIERAKAERAVILNKVDGSMTTEEEAKELLERYGPLDMVATTTTPNRRHGGMSQGMFVRFAYYLDCRDALRLFDNHRSGYNLYLAPSMEPRFRVGAEGRAVVHGFTHPRSSVDQRSIYVGGLPEGTNRAELEEFFSRFGRVQNVSVMRKIYDEVTVNNFGFVEFSHPNEALRATAGELYFQGVKLRVEAKEYSARHNARILGPGDTPQLSTPYNGVGGHNRGEIGVARRGNYNNARYNGRGGRYSYNHGRGAGVGTYNSQSYMTPPATVQYPRHNMQGNAYGTPMQQIVAPNYGMVTPPSQHGMQMSLNQMVPPGIFSPTPSNLVEPQYNYQAVPFGAGMPYNGTQYYDPAQPVYMPQGFQTIYESNEEAYY